MENIGSVENVVMLLREAQDGCSKLQQKCDKLQLEISSLEDESATLDALIAEAESTIAQVPAGIVSTENVIKEHDAILEIGGARITALALEATDMSTNFRKATEKDKAERLSLLLSLDKFCEAAPTAAARRRDENKRLEEERQLKASAEVKEKARISASIAEADAKIAELRTSIEREEAASEKADFEFQELKSKSAPLLVELGELKAAAISVEAEQAIAKDKLATTQAARDGARKKLMLATSRRDALRKRLRSMGLEPCA
jgi:chromosome segregation ATPase